MLLTRGEILAIEDLKTEDVDVPEWGGTVRVRELTGEQRDAFEAGCFHTDGANVSTNFKNLRAKLIARSVINEAGELEFSEKDVKELGKKSGAALDRVFGVCKRISRILDSDIEDLVKNSKGTQGDNLPST